MNHEEVKDVCVDDPVELVVSEFAHFEGALRRVRRDAHLDAVIFEKSRNVVDDGESDDAGDPQTCLSAGVHFGLTKRFAHGAVPVQRHQHRDEDSTGVRYEINGPKQRERGDVELIVVSQMTAVREYGRKNIERN